MNETVLLVDDDAKLKELLGEYIGSYGLRVVALLDGSTVLEAIRHKSPQIVIIDIMLPKQHGLEVLKVIRAEYAVPVVRLTAKGEETDRIVGLELGADDYLPKPFNPRELLARIRAVLRRTPSQGGGLLLKSFPWKIPDEIGRLSGRRAQELDEAKLHHGFGHGWDLYITVPLELPGSEAGRLHLLVGSEHRFKPELAFALGLTHIVLVIALLIIPVSRLITQPVKRWKGGSSRPWN
ncbi:MAG: response regulator, partial [Deltaproteobacteria bacterium]|nr:response regulator [Deltaproteobacteria bacterium]